jgi:hypothetical protein
MKYQVLCNFVKRKSKTNYIVKKTSFSDKLVPHFIQVLHPECQANTN